MTTEATRDRLRLADFLPYVLSVTANTVSAAVARTYEARFGLTIPQWRVMAVLGEHGAMTQSAIGARTAMDKVTVSRAVAGLAQRGLVDSRDGSDRRERVQTLSAEGLAIYAEVVPAARTIEEQITADLSAEDRRTLLELLDRLKSKSSLIGAGISRD